jgi:hypothetical protein
MENKWMYFIIVSLIILFLAFSTNSIFTNDLSLGPAVLDRHENEGETGACCIGEEGETGNEQCEEGLTSNDCQGIGGIYKGGACALNTCLTREEICDRCDREYDECKWACNDDHERGSTEWLDCQQDCDIDRWTGHCRYC